MSIVFFGTYDRTYPANYLLIAALRDADVEIHECHFPLLKQNDPKLTIIKNPLCLAILAGRMFVIYCRLVGRFIRQYRRCSMLLVGYLGQVDMFVAWLLTRVIHKKLVYAPLISLHDTLISDRRQFSEHGWGSKLLFFLDRQAFAKADCLIADTHAQGDFYAATFHIPRKKCVRAFVSADTTRFFPQQIVCDDETIRVLFYGTYIPLHGIETIIEAARILRQETAIHFRLIGQGQMREDISARLKELSLSQVICLDWVTYEDLPHEIASCDIGLGIFGRTAKAERVIPNKVFQILACKKALITADTPAIREFLQAEHHALLVKPGDACALATAIMRFARDIPLRERIAQAGYERFCELAQPKHVGAALLDELLLRGVIKREHRE